MITFILAIVGFVYLLNRIDKLENKVRELSQKRTTSFEEDVSRPIISEKSHVAVPPSPTPIANYVASQPAEAVQKAETISVPIPPPPVPIPSYVEEEQFISTPRPPVEETSELTEFNLGAKVLTSIGVIAIFLGVGFFLRYAIENNWISETMRVAFGVIFGLIMAGIGHVLKKKYESYGFGLVGGGVGVVYLTMYAAYASYNLISFPVAFVILCGITIASITASLAYNSLSLATYSFIGAYIMPFLLPLSSSVHSFFVYLVALNLGVLIIARKKIWPELTVGSLIATSLLCFRWDLSPGLDNVKFETGFYLVVLFFIYFMTSLINFIQRDRDYKGIDGFLIYAIPTVYYVLNIPLITGKESLAIFTLAIGIFYFVSAILIRSLLNSVGDIAKFTNSILVIAASFIAGSIALYFDGQSVTLLWTLQAISMLIVGHILKSSGNRIAGICLALLSGIRLLVVHTVLPFDAAHIFNVRTLLFFMVSLSFAIIWFYYKKFNTDTSLNNDERDIGRYMGGIGVSLLSLLWVTLELFHSVTLHAYLYLPVVWILYSALLIAFSFSLKENIFRNIAYGVSTLTVPVLIISLWELPASYSEPLLNIRLITVVLFILLTAEVVSLMKTFVTDISDQEISIKKAYLVVSNILTFWIVNIEAHNYFENYAEVYIPLVWILYAAVTIRISFVLRQAVHRVFGYVVLMGVVGMVFIFQWRLPEEMYLVIFNIRSLTIIAFILLCAYTLSLLKRFQDQVFADELQLKTTFIVVSNILLFWAVSLEVLQYFNQKITETFVDNNRSLAESLENTKRVVLSVSWLTYAVICLTVGIIYRSVFARQLAIWLFGITIFKIFLYDTANLSDVYRFISFITLGVILLLVGYAYYRFKERITEFVQIENK